MKWLQYGFPIKDYTVAGVKEFSDIRLNVGRATKENKYVCTFYMHGVGVEVFHQPEVEHILSIIQSDTPGAYLELEPYLEKILFTALSQQPEYLEQLFKHHFEEGIKYGRKQKIDEFRKFMSE